MAIELSYCANYRLKSYGVAIMSEGFQPHDDSTLESLNNKLDAHLYQFAEAQQDLRELCYNLAVAQRSNAEAIQGLQKTTEELAESTKGLIELWETANSLHKFIKWVSGLSLLVGLTAWAVDKFIGG